MLVASIAMVTVVAVTARNTVAPESAVFSNVATPWMPAVPLPGGLTSTWFCPGVPAAGAEGTGGSVRVFNTGEATMGGRITVLAAAGEPVIQALSVPAFAMSEFDLDALVDSPYAAAFVEIDGGGGIVEQLAIDPAGHSVTACANTPSDEWYFATGDTVGDSVGFLVLSNPNDDAAIVDITLSTSAGIRTPQSLQNYPVPARSVRVVDVNNAGRDEETDIGVSVVASRGNVVVGRAQTYASEARRGYVMSLAAPTLRDQWFFAYGLKGEGAATTYSVYNPNDTDVDVIPVPLGFSPGDDYLIPETFEVPAGEVRVFSLGDIAGIPDGLVSFVLSTTDAELRVVVERVITQTIENRPTTSVEFGATYRPVDNYMANTWYVGAGVDVAAPGSLRLFNMDAAAAVVTVQAVTPTGVVNVESLAAVDLPENGALTIDLTDDLTLQGYPLIIRSTSRFLVERVMPREPGAQGQVSVWAFPANA